MDVGFRRRLPQLDRRRRHEADVPLPDGRRWHDDRGRMEHRASRMDDGRCDAAADVMGAAIVFAWLAWSIPNTAAAITRSAVGMSLERMVGQVAMAAIVTKAVVGGIGAARSAFRQERQEGLGRHADNQRRQDAARNRFATEPPPNPSPPPPPRRPSNGPQLSPPSGGGSDGAALEYQPGKAGNLTRELGITVSFTRLNENGDGNGNGN